MVASRRVLWNGHFNEGGAALALRDSDDSPATAGRHYGIRSAQ